MKDLCIKNYLHQCSRCAIDKSCIILAHKQTIDNFKDFNNFLPTGLQYYKDEHLPFFNKALQLFYPQYIERLEKILILK